LTLLEKIPISPIFFESSNKLKLLVKKILKFGTLFEYTNKQLFSFSDVRASFLPGFQNV